MSENTNVVIGILDSKGLQTKRTKNLAAELEKIIRSLDEAIKFHLLPLENEIVSRANTHTLTEEFMLQALNTK
jgi:ribonuclease HII